MSTQKDRAQASFRVAPEVVRRASANALVEAGFGSGWFLPFLAGDYGLDHLQRVYTLVAKRARRDREAAVAEGWIVACAAWAGYVPKVGILSWDLVPHEPPQQCPCGAPANYHTIDGLDSQAVCGVFPNCKVPT